MTLPRGMFRSKLRCVIMGSANSFPLAVVRRHRLLAAMEAAGRDEIGVYGNAWQGDYLRYVTDFGILEGHGIAVISADGATELFLDSATDAERAEAEAPGIMVRLAGDIARAVGARLDRVANHRPCGRPRPAVPPPPPP